MMRAFVFMLMMILAGCAMRMTPAQLEEKLVETIGWSENRLVEYLGPPDKVYIASDGARYLGWIESKQILPGGYPYIDPFFITPELRYNPARYSCHLTFTIKEARVVDWQWKGSECLSSYHLEEGVDSSQNKSSTQ
ncbi:MAG: hypothetical protein ACR2N8_03610 [Parvibaculales bacterium]